MSKRQVLKFFGIFWPDNTLLINTFRLNATMLDQSASLENNGSSNSRLDKNWFEYENIQYDVWT